MHHRGGAIVLETGARGFGSRSAILSPTCDGCYLRAKQQDDHLDLFPGITLIDTISKGASPLIAH
jgi:hypothetical protein